MKFVSLEERPWGVLLTLDRPPVNALNGAVLKSLIGALTRLHESQPNVVVITGAGRCFTAGADLKEVQATAKEMHARHGLGRHMLRLLREAPFPVIAAINGACRGAGMNLVSGCDIRIAREDASFGLPEIERGRAGGTASLRGLLPGGVVRWLAFTGDLLDAEEARRLGFVQKVSPISQWEHELNAVADRISAHGKSGLYAIKESLQRTPDLPLGDAHWIEQQISFRLWAAGEREIWPETTRVAPEEGGDVGSEAIGA